MRVKMLSCKCVNTGEDKFTHTNGNERYLIGGEVGNVAVLLYTDGSGKRRVTTTVCKRKDCGDIIELHTKNTVYRLQQMSE